MQIPWSNVDQKTLRKYGTCAFCGCKYTMWHRKEIIDAHNRKDSRSHKKMLKIHQDKIARGEESIAPKLNQRSYEVRCHAHQVGFSLYGGGGRIPCGRCNDGSCGICNSSCNFVCKTSNWKTVRE